MHELGIESSLVKAIENGEKTIEARLGKEKFLQIQPGDVIKVREDVWASGEKITSLPSLIELEVTSVVYFESFAEVFDAVDYKALQPAAKNEKDALAKYRQYYSEEDEKQYGVVVVYFELVNF